MAPLEWLLLLSHRRDGFTRLLQEEKSLAAAAHRVARARCLAKALPSNVPNRWELHAAAKEIASHVGLPTPTPPPAVLASDCEAEGLPVL